MFFLQKSFNVLLFCRLQSLLPMSLFLWANSHAITGEYTNICCCFFSVMKKWSLNHPVWIFHINICNNINKNMYCFFKKRVLFMFVAALRLQTLNLWYWTKLSILSAVYFGKTIEPATLERVYHVSNCRNRWK